MSSIPEGIISVKGTIVETRVDYYNPTKVMCDIITRDPYSGELIQLNNVTLVQNNPMMPEGISDEQPCLVNSPSYEIYRRKITEQITASLPPREGPTQNQSLPPFAKIKSQVDSFSSKPSAVCKDMNDRKRDVDSELGLLHKRDDITILQGKNNGRSPGVLIHQGNGDVCLFDGTGKQFVNINSTNGIQFSAGNIDMGSAKQSKNSMAYAGMPGYENPVSDLLPHGTILTPHPKLLPDITRTINTILPILDLIDLGRACKEAYDNIYG